MALETSILKTVRDVSGLNKEDDTFDLELITYVNGAFSNLQQMGIGPADGFSIEDDTASWTDFVSEDALIKNLRTYICLSVKLLFDPPTTSFVLNMFKEQIDEQAWRLNLMEQTAPPAEPVP